MYYSIPASCEDQVVMVQRVMFLFSEVRELYTNTIVFLVYKYKEIRSIVAAQRQVYYFQPRVEGQVVVVQHLVFLVSEIEDLYRNTINPHQPKRHLY